MRGLPRISLRSSGLRLLTECPLCRQKRSSPRVFPAKLENRELAWFGRQHYCDACHGGRASAEL